MYYVNCHCLLQIAARWGDRGVFGELPPPWGLGPLAKRPRGRAVRGSRAPAAAVGPGAHSRGARGGTSAESPTEINKSCRKELPAIRDPYNQDLTGNLFAKFTCCTPRLKWF